MSWSQQGTDWRRPLDCHDKLFQSVAAAGKPLGREHWLLIGVAQIALSSGTGDIQGRLRNAWAALRFRHPDIALELLDGEKRYQPVTTIEALESWLAATFRVETAVQSADELSSRHLKGFSASATCHWIPASNEVAIVSSHWRWDGRGLLMLINELLAKSAAHDSPPEPSSSGHEVANLVPSIDVSIGMPERPQATWLQRADEMLAPFQQGCPSIGLPITTGTLPGDTRRATTVLPRDDAAAVRVACRARGLRLTAALHASIIEETARHQQSPSSGTERFKSWAVFDLRKYCPAPSNGPSHAPSLRMLGLPFDADASAAWDELAASLQRVYEQSLSTADGDLLYVRVPLVERATAMLQTAAPTADPNLSNIGVIDEYVRKKYGDMSVRNVWMAVHMLSPQLYVHAWSWDGELHLSVCYNEAFYEADFVETWVEKLRDSLLTNLGVK